MIKPQPLSVPNLPPLIFRLHPHHGRARSSPAEESICGCSNSSSTVLRRSGIVYTCVFGNVFLIVGGAPYPCSSFISYWMTCGPCHALVFRQLNTSLSFCMTSRPFLPATPLKKVCDEMHVCWRLLRGQRRALTFDTGSILIQSKQEFFSI